MTDNNILSLVTASDSEGDYQSVDVVPVPSPKKAVRPKISIRLNDTVYRQPSDDVRVVSDTATGIAATVSTAQPPPPPPSRRFRQYNRRRRRRRYQQRESFWPPSIYFDVVRRELNNIATDPDAFDRLCHDWDMLHLGDRRMFLSMEGFNRVFGTEVGRKMFVFSVATNGTLRNMFNRHRRERNARHDVDWRAGCHPAMF